MQASLRELPGSGLCDVPRVERQQPARHRGSRDRGPLPTTPRCTIAGARPIPVSRPAISATSRSPARARYGLLARTRCGQPDVGRGPCCGWCGVMQANAGLGILQTLVVGRPATTAFARIFQFGMRPRHGARTPPGSPGGRDRAGHTGATTRSFACDPFIEHCALPVLPGRSPLSGHVLSHDQVEAALMRAAGWEVRVIADEFRLLGGKSAEPCPTSSGATCAGARATCSICG